MIGDGWMDGWMDRNNSSTRHPDDEEEWMDERIMFDGE